MLSIKFRDIQKKLQHYGIKSPKFRKRLVSKWESLNYDRVENELYWREFDESTSKRQLTLRWLGRWVISFFIGVFTALLAAVLHVIVENVCHVKFSLLSHFLDKCAKEGCMYQAALIWITINFVVTLMGSALIVYLQPMAAGGGIPFLKAYLNGVKIPGFLTLEAFIAKVGGVILAIVGGLAIGKEGPMAHAGGIIGAGLGKGRLRLCRNKQLSLYDSFRNDHEIRDFVAAGTASGVAAAFGAPVGGTLFSVEEAASFWSQEMTWRIFFSAMVGSFFTNYLLSSFHGDPSKLSAPGLVRLNGTDLSFDVREVPIFLIMGVVAGLIGAAFVVISYKLAVFRRKYFTKKWTKLLEAGVVASCSGIVAFLMMYLIDDCTDKQPYNSHAAISKMYCEGNKHHSLSTMLLASPEGSLKGLLHDPYGTFQPEGLALFAISYFFLAVWAYGLSVSAGIFIPSLILGAAWGRLFGLGVLYFFPGDSEYADDVLRKYALIGAASQLSGMMRTTISLTVMVVECTGEISLGLPIMINLVISKWVGDFVSTGLYDMNIEVIGLPLLAWEPPPLCEDIKASDLMSQPVTFFNTKEKVGRIVEQLKTVTHNGFPVTSPNPDNPNEPGKLLGLILKSQLLVLLKHKAFSPQGTHQSSTLRLKDFTKYYLQYLKIEEIEVSKAESDYIIDLKPYLLPNPYTVDPTFTLPRLFRLFRGLGLRHLVVINDNYQ
ncbi:hypothetical protein ACJMK2_010137, partial [Sinanodonta woodiana]